MSCSESPPPADGTGREAWFARLTRLVEPEQNPAGVVYGTILAGSLLAAEVPKHDTLPRAAGAVAISLALYWIAHAHAHDAGTRLEAGSSWSIRTLARSAVRELNLIRGAFVPLVVLLAAWAAGAGASSAVGAALISAVAMLFVLELIAALRSGRGPGAVVGSVVVSMALGAGVLAVNILLH